MCNLINFVKRRNYSVLVLLLSVDLTTLDLELHFVFLGIFAVPKELCADMYVYAAASFSKTRLPSECPKELHIIDVDTKILQLVVESVKRWQQDHESLNQRKTVPEYLKKNPQLTFQVIILKVIGLLPVIEATGMVAGVRTQEPIMVMVYMEMCQGLLCLCKVMKVHWS